MQTKKALSDNFPPDWGELGISSGAALYAGLELAKLAGRFQAVLWDNRINSTQPRNRAIGFQTIHLKNSKRAVPFCHFAKLFDEVVTKV